MRAGTGDAQSGTALVEALRRQHQEALATLVRGESQRSSVARRVDDTLGEGRRLFDGTALLRELRPLALDTISSLGERPRAPILCRP